MAKSTDAEVERRISELRQIMADGHYSRAETRRLAELWGCSERQVREYARKVKVAMWNHRDPDDRDDLLWDNLDRLMRARDECLELQRWGEAIAAMKALNVILGESRVEITHRKAAAEKPVPPEVQRLIQDADAGDATAAKEYKLWAMTGHTDREQQKRALDTALRIWNSLAGADALEDIAANTEQQRKVVA
jgi:hypothetical protein